MLYVIWSIEHAAWWRVNWCGYTRTLADAGRYTEAAANEVLARANVVEVNECKIPIACVTPAEESHE